MLKNIPDNLLIAARGFPFFLWEITLTNGVRIQVNLVGMSLIEYFAVRSQDFPVALSELRVRDTR